MRLGSLVVIGLAGATLAACNADRGALIVVQSADDLGVTEVRLYVGTGSATDHALELPISNTAIDDARYWTRDPTNGSDDLLASGGSFELRSDDDLPAIIIVGFDANHHAVAAGSLFDVQVPRSDVFEYTVALAATDELGLWSPRPMPEDDLAACAGIAGIPGQPPSFIVTAGDQDCDSWVDGTAAECEPFTYDFADVPQLDDLTCIPPQAGGNGPQLCPLGGAGCSDGPGESACMPSTTCAPVTSCMECMNDIGCVRRDPMEATPINAVETCVLQIGSTCNSPVYVELPAVGLPCSAPMLWNYAAMRWNPTVTIEGLTLTASVSGSCAVALTVTVTGSVIGSSGFGLLLSVTLGNGNGLAIPIDFSVTNGGTNCQPSACDFGGLAHDTSLYDCAAPWRAPSPVELPRDGMTHIDRAPTLTSDELEMVFVRDGMLYTTTRSAIGAPWTPPVVALVGYAAAFSYEATPHFADDLTLYFSGPDFGDPSTGGDIYMTQRAVRGATWQTPTFVQNLFSSADDEGASLSETGDLALVASARGGGTYHIYQSTSTSAFVSSLWTPGYVVAEDGMVNDHNPFAWRDGLTVFFSSDRLQPDRLQLFIANRTTTTASFAPALPISELNSGFDDTDPWVSADGQTIFLASDRAAGGGGAYQIYEAQR